MEQLYALPLRNDLQRWFVDYIRWLERHLNAGEYRHGMVAALFAVLPPVLIIAALHYLLLSAHPLLAFLWSAAVLYLTLGFRTFSHTFTEISSALQSGDIPAARSKLAAWRMESGVELSSNEVARLTIEQGLLDSYRHVFGAVFWFLLLPGPCGAVLYRLAVVLAREWRTKNATVDQEQFGRFSEQVLYYLDWLPVRLTALSFAIVGDFEDAIQCWRTQAGQWHLPEQGILLSSGAGALGVRLGEPLRAVDGGVIYRPEIGLGDIAEADYLQSAVGLIWRALLLWLVVIFMLSLVAWVS